MGVGTATTTHDNEIVGPSWYCLYCDSHHPIAFKGEPPPMWCPTPGCRCPHGFGKYADRPAPPVRSRTYPPPRW